MKNNYKKLIENRLKQINKTLNRPETQYLKIDGKYVENHGHIYIERYNGMNRVTVSPGSRNLGPGMMTGPECLFYLDGILAGIELTIK
jgi:hypothetical protein